MLNQMVWTLSGMVALDGEQCVFEHIPVHEFVVFQALPFHLHT
jgi:hypothetical protein